MDTKSEEYQQLRQQEVEFWRTAAARRRELGQMAVAITFDNVAWLLERQDLWFVEAETPS
jgi:hypothetical protein